MRIFTAFPLEAGDRRKLYEGYAPVRGSLDSVKWVAEENLHITLVFLGEISPEELDGLLRALDAVPWGTSTDGPNTPGPSGFRLEYRGIECFPPRGKPKVIYSGITVGTEACIEVWELLIGILRSAGMAGDAVKPYVPHITLGRIKAKGYYPRPGGYEQITGALDVSSFGVFESRLTPEGPIYRLLRNYTLSDETV
jgi:2'-5' RNA ligase